MDRRHRRVVNSWAQLLIAIEVILHALLFVALLGLVFFAEPFATMFSGYSLEDHQAIGRELWQLNAVKWPLFFAVAAVTALVSVLFSHQIVGPIVKLQRIFKQLGERNLNVNATFRKHDYLSELEKPLALLIARWSEDLHSIELNQKRAQASLEQIKNRGNDDSEPTKELEDALRSISHTINDYQGIK